MKERLFMTGQPNVDKILKEWILKADRDLKTSSHLLKIKDVDLFDSICFHCQQAAEKYLKSLFVYRQVEFPRSHDISLLLEKLPPQDQLHFRNLDLTEFNPFAVDMRYPGEIESIDVESVLRIFNLATKVQSIVKNLISQKI